MVNNFFKMLLISGAAIVRQSLGVRHIRRWVKLEVFFLDLKRDDKIKSIGIWYWWF